MKDNLEMPGNWCQVCELTRAMAELNLCETMKELACRKLEDRGRKSDDGDEQVVRRERGSCLAVKRVAETTAPSLPISEVPPIEKAEEPTERSIWDIS